MKTASGKPLHPSECGLPRQVRTSATVFNPYHHCCASRTLCHYQTTTPKTAAPAVVTLIRFRGSRRFAVVVVKVVGGVVAVDVPVVVAVHGHGRRRLRRRSRRRTTASRCRSRIKSRSVTVVLC